jgi:hypothetical protein
MLNVKFRTIKTKNGDTLMELRQTRQDTEQLLTNAKSYIDKDVKQLLTAGEGKLQACYFSVYHAQWCCSAPAAVEQDC